jgi:MFS family permease
LGRTTKARRRANRCANVKPLARVCRNTRPRFDPARDVGFWRKSDKDRSYAVQAMVRYWCANLAVFLAVHRATASFGIAGVAVGAFSIGSGALAPFRGRILDRHGVRPWLTILATLYGLSLALLALYAQLEPIGWLLVFFAGAAGASAAARRVCSRAVAATKFGWFAQCLVPPTSS